MGAERAALPLGSLIEIVAVFFDFGFEACRQGGAGFAECLEDFAGFDLVVDSFFAGPIGGGWAEVADAIGELHNPDFSSFCLDAAE